MDRSKIIAGSGVRVKAPFDFAMGVRVGTVDYLGSDGFIHLDEEGAGSGEHRSIPFDLVGRVDSENIYLICDLSEYSKFVKLGAPHLNDGT